MLETLSEDGKVKQFFLKLWIWVLARVEMASDFIAKIGQNIQFVAFFAHAGVASWVELFGYKHKWIAAACIVVAGGVKEYGYDAREEKNPPQTFAMNTQDFLGFVAGVVVALWILRRLHVA